MRCDFLDREGQDIGSVKIQLDECSKLSGVLTQKYPNAQEFLNANKPPYFEGYTITLVDDGGSVPCFGFASIHTVNLLLIIALIAVQLSDFTN